MGREGIAYTFVTTEEGGELTRIEILINRLLKRDEIAGFAAVATVAPLAGPVGSVSATTSPSGDAPNEEPPSPQAPRAAPPGRRPMKRHRRAL
jgi:ATP-dependent RNA helicase DeaD